MDDSRWYYYKEDDELYRFKIEEDNDPINPRFDWDHMGTMNIWWDRYSLGDNKGNGDPDEMLSDLIRENVPKETLIKKALDGEFKIPEYKWDEEEKCYTEPAADGDVYLIGSDDELVDEILNEMSTNEKRMLLQYYIVLLPCFIYEHSGITISCSNSYPYNDRWDAGMAGFIYATKERYCKWMDVKEVDDVTFRKRAHECLVEEVKEYDMYLQNECYGFVREKYNSETDDWDDDDSVWGFLTDEWGDKLVEFFRSELTTEPLIDEDKAIEIAEAMHKEYLTMDQANTIVAI